MAAVEFGVARGAFLVALEHASAQIETALGIAISVYGFDSGKGNPKPVDYRDLRYI